MHLTLEQQLNEPGVNVWGGISSSCIYGPFFLDKTMTGDKYLKILKNQILSQLWQLPNLRYFYFQQDGVPPHYSKGVREYLDETFPLTWIGQRAPIDWLACSLDLTLWIFSFGEY